MPDSYEVSLMHDFANSAMKVLENSVVRNAGETKPQQTEFTMSVPVCAWCKPRSGAVSLTVLSHGICPRHLKKMRSKLQSKSAKR
jgi:hypothetical protein